MANQYINLRQAKQVFDIKGESVEPTEAFDINGDPINHIGWNAYHRDASQWSAYPPLPADNFSRIADNTHVMPFMGAPAAPQMPFYLPVPSHYPHLSEPYHPLSSEPYPPLPLSPSPPPSPSPSDLALSDYEPSPPWTQTVAHQHLAPLTASAADARYGGADAHLAPYFAPDIVAFQHLAPLTAPVLVDRYASEQRAPSFRPRCFLSADKSPLPPLRPAPPTQVRRKRSEVVVPARPAQMKRRRSVDARVDPSPRPAPAPRKGKSASRNAAPRAIARTAAAPRTITTVASARKCSAVAEVIYVGGKPDEVDDDDDSEFNSGSEIGEPDSEYDETAPRRRR
ncbi:hypothetical protein B0T18DRAFT_445911 [Schizothecium vesticola]|uniref:Uncharacterized protein n=1 Tax=Schizothecium vesticola TaxID=314040 RepID=A0AA40K908_9PEZI|nr:hypothetical protein B0T18DRAFT_445911 [Schizothecium vesticola]